METAEQIMNRLAAEGSCYFNVGKNVPCASFYGSYKELEIIKVKFRYARVEQRGTLVKKDRFIGEPSEAVAQAYGAGKADAWALIVFDSLDEDKKRYAKQVIEACKK